MRFFRSLVLGIASVAAGLALAQEKLADNMKILRENPGGQLLTEA